jgi:hypothetical protein
MFAMIEVEEGVRAEVRGQKQRSEVRGQTVRINSSTYIF